jgi:energy-coupling factor transporter ATP-binding protein EcfA2
VINIVTTKFAFDRATLPFRTDFSVAGTTCILSTNSLEVLRTVADWRVPRKQVNGKTFAMEIIVDPAQDNHCERNAYFRGVRHLVFAFISPRSFVTYDLVRRRVHAVLSTTAARDTDFWKRLLIPITIGVLGTTIGVVPLHCACLERNGRGLLVAGASGAGKSTLAAAMALLGFRIISDDWTYVSKRDTTLVAHGLLTPLKLLPDAVQFFSELHNFTPGTALNGELAYQIDPQLLGCEVGETSSPRAILFLDRCSTTGCEILPCPPEHVRTFFENSAERLPEEIPQAKAFRTEVIRTLAARPAWIVRTSESPQQTAKVIEDFLLEADHATV